MHTGEIIRELRDQRNYTQTQLSKALNITAPTLSKYETGKSQPPLDFLIAFADLMNVSVDYLLGRNRLQYDYSCLNKEYTRTVKTSTLFNDILALKGKQREVLVGVVFALICQNEVENMSRRKT